MLSSSSMPPCSTRTKSILEGCIDKSSKKMKIDELPLLPFMKYETAFFFCGHSESTIQKKRHVQDILEAFFHKKQVIETHESDVESTFDDSDKDKDYNPTSSSDSDDDIVTTKNKKPTLLQSSTSRKALMLKTINSNGLSGERNPKTSKKDFKEETGRENKVSNSCVRDENLENSRVDLEDTEKIKNINKLQCQSEEGKKNISSEARIKKKSKLSQNEKIDRDKGKHPIRDKCSGKCRRDCKKLEEHQRRKIWEGYWSLDYSSRRKWLTKHVKLLPVKRKSALAHTHRAESRQFTLPKADHTDLSVCRLTFLNTLGYTNDSVITELVVAMKLVPCGTFIRERRGTHPKQKTNTDVIKEHIESFNPSVSHYSRKHAPNVRYLPRELTIKMMYDDFNTKNPNHCKIDKYREVLKSMHISLYQPKSDICEECTTLNNILHSNGDGPINNNYITKLNLHRQKAERAILEYKKDSKEAAQNGLSKRIYSMDLQKVMLLPIMPECKSSFFTSRLVVFNQTFATLNSNATNKSYCVVWHEAIGGRKAEALVDAMLKVVRKERDAKEFIFWADNCTSQNKNWVLYTSLVSEVNRSTGPNQITVRYLTKGHTHMSADGIHGNIEKKIRRKRNLYDFDELLQVIETSRKNVQVLELKDFNFWQSKKRTAKKNDDSLKNFTVNDVVEVRFSKGNKTLMYKTDFASEYSELDFLQKKFSLTSFIPNVVPIRGISSAKKQKILKELVPMMPLNRKTFWETLSESDTSVDLIHKDQISLDSDVDPLLKTGDME